MSLTEPNFGPTGVAPDTCKYCDYPNITIEPSGHWIWTPDVKLKSGGRFRCRVQKRRLSRESHERMRLDPIRFKKYKSSQRDWADRNPNWVRFKSYVYSDKNLNRNTLIWGQAEVLMSSECFYCGHPQANGLDRKDNTLGHEFLNVVPCCMKCNFILGDIPYEAKLQLKDGLKKIEEKGLLETWQITTLRNR